MCDQNRQIARTYAWITPPADTDTWRPKLKILKSMACQINTQAVRALNLHRAMLASTKLHVKMLSEQPTAQGP